MVVELISTEAENITLTFAGEGDVHSINYSNTDCPNGTYEVITNITERMYTLTDLEEGTNYSITVSATSKEGGHGEYYLTANTTTTGQYTFCQLISLPVNVLFVYSSICSSYFCEIVKSNLLQYHSPVGASGLYPPEWRHNWLYSVVQGGEEW